MKVYCFQKTDFEIISNRVFQPVRHIRDQVLLHTCQIDRYILRRFSIASILA
jgi:hypothetical protein